MKWFQPIECDNTVKKPLVCDYDNLEEYGFDQYSFKTGIIINNWNMNIFMQAKAKRYSGNPDDALQNYLMIPIYSERFRVTLGNAGIEGIQYLPIKVLRSNTDSIDGFCIANILNFIEAFDYEKSDYDRFDEDFPNPNVRGEISGVRRFVLKKEKLNALDIIRLKEYELSFFVSEKFKEVFERNKFTGYSFREVELV